MPDDAILNGKRVLIVDDEPDVLETIGELLSLCLIDKAPSFETGIKFLAKNTYDVAILDIMGVRGYDLLRVTTEKNIPTIMLTAHAISPGSLIKSIKEGAHCYVPKDRLQDIAVFVRDILEEPQRSAGKSKRWFTDLKPFFDERFGPGWREKNKEFWDDFDANRPVSKKELERIM